MTYYTQNAVTRQIYSEKWCVNGRTIVAIFCVSVCAVISNPKAVNFGLHLCPGPLLINYK